MFNTKILLLLTVALLLIWIDPTSGSSGRRSPTPTPTAAPAAPLPPVLVAPANGASLVQPITLDWDPVSVPGGPTGSYTWQIGTTSAFTTVIASGFTNMDGDPSVPTPTADKVSGLPNGTYFWRVKDSQLGPNGGVDSPWSAVRSFTVTGPGVAPAAPIFITPTSPREFSRDRIFRHQMVGGSRRALLLEADDEPFPTFTLTTNAMTFGTKRRPFGATRSRTFTIACAPSRRQRAQPAVGHAECPHRQRGARAVRGFASRTGSGGKRFAPFLFDWPDTANPQVLGYDLQVDTSPNFTNMSFYYKASRDPIT